VGWTAEERLCPLVSPRPRRPHWCKPCRGTGRSLHSRFAVHDINAYINLLKRDGNLVLVGAPGEPLAVAAFPLIFRRRSFSGSLIGGLPETQEMLDFCGTHNLTCDVEMIRMDQINDAYERMLKSDVKYRFVIDMASLV
jgi:uncharacterized zinc-type alcohol dehydrogenase-like protein